MNEITIVKKLLKNPEEVIDLYDLTYTTNEILTIKRIKKSNTFKYLDNGKPLTKEDQLKRIESLVIPPAWENVQIARLHNAHLQATGRDAKLRKQYRYHPMWMKLRNQTKFLKMLAFSQVLPKIRKRSTRDLSLPGWPREKVMALIVKLMEESHIRIGNHYYARKNKTYGLATLRTKHVDVFKDRIKFEFRGKRGKLHSVTIRNKKLARLVNRSEEIPGWELFQYYDENGKKQKVDSGMVNTYIQQISGSIFSAKDFRTWSASLIVFDTLKELGIPKSKKSRDKNIIKAIDTAAEALNNTRAVCRKYYVHPFVLDSYLDGSIGTYFNKAEKIKISSDANALQPSELALQELIKKYKPEVL